MVNVEFLRAGALAVRENGTYAPLSGEAWIYALEMTLLGMGMIFSVLGVLWGVLAIFKLIFAKPASKAKSKAKEAPKAVEEPSAQATPAPEATSSAATDDAALVAILTAAIVAYESENGNEVDPSSFRVVSFRRANGGRAWNSK